MDNAASDRNGPQVQDASAFPAETPIGMAYVPMQKFRTVFDTDVALTQGTIFPELDKPWLGGRAFSNMRGRMGNMRGSNDSSSGTPNGGTVSGASDSKKTAGTPNSGTVSGASDGGKAAGTPNSGTVSGASDGGKAAGTPNSGTVSGASDSGKTAGTPDHTSDTAGKNSLWSAAASDTVPGMPDRWTFPDPPDAKNRRAPLGRRQAK